ncbi:MAG TPA: LysM peptidoglycan-binding domain-containing protein [Gemmatimonadaceae bacterium]|nr:LysM peptidoglycan-binding domain-containing protein [Gemmatimonadaceae bacterium]
MIAGPSGIEVSEVEYVTLDDAKSGEFTVIRPRRRRRRVLATAGVVLGFIVLFFGGGYALWQGHLDPVTARAILTRELSTYALEPGETLRASAYLYWRSPLSYFRSTHAVLAATDRRLLLLTLMPPDPLTREAETSLPTIRDLPKDTTVRVDTGRVMLGTSRGITLRAQDVRESWAARDEQWPSVRAVVADLSTVQRTMREDADAIALARLAAVERARQPIWHKVARGEALSSIATQYGTTPERLRQLNAMANDRIRTGDSLLIKPRT